ncbi:MAG TPA: hypothetical protein VF452_01090 [Candidatus Binatia bacterium]
MERELAPLLLSDDGALGDLFVVLGYEANVAPISFTFPAAKIIQNDDSGLISPHRWIALTAAT